MNALERLILERHGRAHAGAVRALQTMMNTAPRESYRQAALFELAPTAARCEHVPDPAGVQSSFDGSETSLCVRCGAPCPTSASLSPI